MRIIGNIDSPTLKVTVFKMDNKLSVKFETGLYEQTFKFRESNELNDFESVKKLVDERLKEEVMENFAKMHRSKNEALGRFLQQAGAGFEEII
ncbi:MAG: hypothetical protein K9J37_00195 [Saprospiraceae bacterium]|nr:hypothetical protein [Saprospiraceae bacterium]MCF8248292.1 hypothetical protein [Saprospiraceae bacterium]MCF8279954.1 hypothetical protein [Bacteroidales bacterium]MCF8309820.1 hypothetical protein [Saprospiraceae bacterium]MCF8438849.1 hypothetical protein [Saprospiraceae bacterium]